MDNFADRLKEERKRLGLKGLDLASISGVSVVAQSNYETGKRCPDAVYLSALADVGFDVHYLLTGERAQEQRLTPEQRVLLAQWEAASPALRAAAMAVLVSGQTTTVKNVHIGRDNNGSFQM